MLKGLLEEICSRLTRIEENTPVVFDYHPDDLVILTHPRVLSEGAHVRLRNQITAAMERGKGAVVLEEGMRVAAIVRRAARA